MLWRKALCRRLNRLSLWRIPISRKDVAHIVAVYRQGIQSTDQFFRGALQGGPIPEYRILTVANVNPLALATCCRVSLSFKMTRAKIVFAIFYPTPFPSYRTTAGRAVGAQPGCYTPNKGLPHDHRIKDTRRDH